MSSNQVPPPPANFSFPPADSKLHFNYIDSFATSWITPEFCKDPCFLSLYFYNFSNPNAPWTRQLNQTVSLNGTKLVPLDYIDSDGLGQLNLNYLDPDGSHQKVVGTIFTINHDPTQPKAVTWNQNALSSSSPSTTSSQQAAPTSTPLAPSTVLQPPTLTPSTANTSSALGGGHIASIVLGTILGILVTALLIMFWIRRHRKKRLSKQDVRRPSAATPPNSTWYPLHEKDAITVPNELSSGHAQWELPVDRH